MVPVISAPKSSVLPCPRGVAQVAELGHSFTGRVKCIEIGQIGAYSKPHQSGLPMGHIGSDVSLWEYCPKGVLCECFLLHHSHGVNNHPTSSLQLVRRKPVQLERSAVVIWVMLTVT